MSLFWKLAAGVGIFANISICIYLASLLFVPVEVLTLPRYSIVELTTGSVYEPGDSVRFHAEFCKLTDHPTTIIRQLVNGQVIPLVEYSSNLGIGCYSSESASIVLPQDVAEGPHKIRSTYQYRVNPFRTETYIHETEEFLICSDCKS